MILALLAIAALGAASNEWIRRQLYCDARETLAALKIAATSTPAPPRKDHVPPRKDHAPTRSVADFTRQLSQRERRAWRETPRFTSAGYRLARLAPDLRAGLERFQRQSQPQPELGVDALRGEVLVDRLSKHLEARLEIYLRALLEDWTGQELVFVNSYGPRTYARGSSLLAHGDRLETHALSAIVFVEARALDSPWPLQFVPNGASDEDAVQELFLDADTDVLLYESTQPHGRVDPLRGESFTAIFFHWHPPKWRDFARTL